MSSTETVIAGDWYPGTIPGNARLGPDAYVASCFSFRKFGSERVPGLVLEKSASLYDSVILHLGRAGHVRFGPFALMAGGALFCESEIEIGAYSLIAWDVVLMDSPLLCLDRRQRRAELEAAAFHPTRTLISSVRPRPIQIGQNVWISFGACILPGVKIGDHSIVGARAVVRESVPAASVVAGNPARVVRVLPEEARVECCPVTNTPAANGREAEIAS